MKLIDQLRECSDTKLNTDYSEKYKLINEILQSDDCFFNMKIETALSILSDLGYSTSEAKKIYYDLISLDSYEDINPQYIIEDDSTYELSNITDEE